MRVSLGVRILAIALVCAVVSLAGSAVAGAVTVRSGTYVGVASHGGVVLIAVGPGGRAITPLSIIRYAEGGVGFDRVRIRRGGRFDRRIADGEGQESVAGRIMSSGLVRGHYRFINRGGGGSGSFSARFVRGLAGHGDRIFSLYGSDNQAADNTTNLDRSGVPATEIGSLPVGVTQLPDGRVVVLDAPGANQAVLNSVTPFGFERHIGGGVQARGRGNGGPVTKAGFDNPGVVVARPDGSYLITDNASCVRAVSPAGIIIDAAGICGPVPGGPGANTPLGDGGPAPNAYLSDPQGLTVLPDGGFLIADSGGGRVREVSPAGIITTVAGNGRTGFSGDGGPATSARLSYPTDVAALPGGGFLIADTGNHRVREVAPDGTIVTVAGGHPVTLAHGLGDGRPATQAAVPSPVALLVRPDRSFLVGDDTLGMIRRIAPDGTISTIAGGGPFGYGAAAINAQVAIGQMTALSDGGIAIANGATVDEIAPAETPRLLIALRPGHLRVRTSQRATITVTATRAARLTIRVRAAHGYQRTLHASVGAGQTRVRLPQLPAGASTARFIAHAGPRVATASVLINQ